eukprot:SM000048S16598  [mRNA]  locus=s48:621455:625861:- [translate_table: standard]
MASLCWISALFDSRELTYYNFALHALNLRVHWDWAAAEPAAGQDAFNNVVKEQLAGSGGSAGSSARDAAVLDPAGLARYAAMLGLQSPVPEREEAALALWRHAKGGRACVDQIAHMPGCLNLLVLLLGSGGSPPAAEAAAGLLQSVAAVEDYRLELLSAGALEEVAGLLLRGAPPAVEEQAAGLLVSLSTAVAETPRIVELGLLPKLVAMLDPAHRAIQEAAAKALANVTRWPGAWEQVAEIGGIRKLAQLVLEESTSGLARQSARNALTELCKAPFLRALMIEEGLVVVPLIGADAYRSFKPLLHEAPQLPQSVKLERRTLQADKDGDFGAGSLLLGLSVNDEASQLDERAQQELEGKVRQQFLARLGILEKAQAKQRTASDQSLNTVAGDRQPQDEMAGPANGGISSGDRSMDNAERVTVMPRLDGVPRLVLILGLDDATVAGRAARAAAEFAMTDDNRQAMRNAGAIPHLVRLLGSGDEEATAAAAVALSQLAISAPVRGSICSHGAIPALVALLNAKSAPIGVKEQVMGTLLRLSDTDNYSGTADQDVGLLEMLRAGEGSQETPDESGNVPRGKPSAMLDPRQELLEAGGLPPLLELLHVGSMNQKQLAAKVLVNIASERSNADAMVSAGIIDALEMALHLQHAPGTTTAGEGLDESQEGLPLEESEGVPVMEELWQMQAACGRVVELLATYVTGDTAFALRKARLSAVLRDLLQAEVPLSVKEQAAAALLKLEDRPPSLGFFKAPDAGVEKEVAMLSLLPSLVEQLSTAPALEMREEAVLTLRDLVQSGGDDFVAALASAGGIFPVVELLGSSEDRVREAALTILCKLAIVEENQPAILAAGAPDALERVVKRGRADWELALRVLRLLPV